jgi:hypothetical protein
MAINCTRISPEPEKSGAVLSRQGKIPMPQILVGVVKVALFLLRSDKIPGDVTSVWRL